SVRSRPAAAAASRQLPREAALTLLVGTYPVGAAASTEGLRAMTDWLETSGFQVFYADIDLGAQGHWQRVLAGAYTDPEMARRDAARINAAAPQLDAHVVGAGAAGGGSAAGGTTP
ncbi:MAG TPA: SPOR domain-containing protein, partial [Vicinamibacterales bacterium]|nr:SPOR domain-containing protein [Vicinamibacterales bacterium]